VDSATYGELHRQYFPKRHKREHDRRPRRRGHILCSNQGNVTLEADRDLRVLRQRTSAAAYRAEFSILAAKVGWNDDALASQFYRGLKDQVRTEITMHYERPSTLRDMADLAIRIDTCIFEVQLEKKGSYF
jgi:hypothetical protein